MKKIIAAYLSAHSMYMAVNAQTPALVKDIYTGTTSSASSLNGIQLNGNFIFKAYSAGIGRELWITDGTTGGTFLLKDINPGTADGDCVGFTLFNGALYFLADNGVTGRELWKTDGTMAGTQLVKDVYPGSSSGFSLTGFVKVWEHNGSFFFTAHSSNSDVELWKSDGTTAGTVRVADIYPGTTGSDPMGFTEFNNTLFFIADNGTNGRELWKSDGSTAGTVMVKDIFTGSTSAFFLPCCGILNLKKVWEHSGSFFFLAINVSSDVELWKSDGSAAGTVRVADIYPGSTSSDPEDFIDINGTLFFTADNGTTGRELWKTDGTTAGTQLVKDIFAGSNSGFVEFCCGTFGLRKIWEHNGSFFFVANTSTSDDLELWKSDGSTAGTVRVSDINPGTAGSMPEDFMEFNNTLYFTADNGTAGREIWKTDGTTGGTQIVKDIFPGSNSAFMKFCCGAFYFRNVWEHNGSFFFIANTSGSDDIELWKSDGSAAGTVRVADINPGTTGSDPAGFVPFNNLLLFSAFTAAQGREVWKTDGTTAGTQLVKDIYSGTGNGIPYSFYNFISYNGAVYFTAFSQSSSDNEIWKTDGTTSGTQEVMDIYTGTNGSYANSFTLLPNDNLIFIAEDATHGEELWSMYFSGATSVEENKATGFNVFPNPTVNGLLNVQLPGMENAVVTVTDMHGRDVMTKEIQTSPFIGIAHLQLPALKPGMYLLHITGRDFNGVMKIFLTGS
jgi:trimeric autotransporter adhesin